MARVEANGKVVVSGGVFQTENVEECEFGIHGKGRRPL